jgi:hypothetical protein
MGFQWALSLPTQALILNDRGALWVSIKLMKPNCLASIMNWSKNLYIFMLGALIVFSGCFGTGTSNGDDGDADDAASTATNVINNYYNNTTSVIEDIPEHIAITVIGQHGNNSYGITIFNLHQNSGEAIHLLDWRAVSEYSPDTRDVNTTIWSDFIVQTTTVNTICVNGYEWSESITQLGPNMSYEKDQWLAWAGLECTHHFSLEGLDDLPASREYREDWMSVIYQIVPVVVA